MSWHDGAMSRNPNVRADAACVIIAGGKASRLNGRVKALIEIGGQSILDRALSVVAPRFAAVAIAANDPTPYEGMDIPVLPDRVLDRGPLAGIEAGLLWCRRPYMLAVACDMPYLEGPIVDLLLDRRAPGIDAVAPFIGDRPEPLFALYSPRILPVLQRRLEAGEFRASALLTDENINVSRVYEAELRSMDPGLSCLANVNTAEDLAALQRA